jgi:hypothetical protein
LRWSVFIAADVLYFLKLRHTTVGICCCVINNLVTQETTCGARTSRRTRWPLNYNWTEQNSGLELNR